MVVDRRHLEPTAEEARHHGGDLLVEQHEIAHDHRLIAHLLERGVRAERESRLHGHALDRHREIGARHSDSKDVTVLELPGLPSACSTAFQSGSAAGTAVAEQTVPATAPMRIASVRLVIRMAGISCYARSL